MYVGLEYVFCEQWQHHGSYSASDCHQCYIAECVSEYLSLVSQDFNSKRGMTL